MSLYYVEDAAGAWQWVEAADLRDAAEQVAGEGVAVVLVSVTQKSYPIIRYRVRDSATGEPVTRLDVTHERYLAGAAGGEE